MLMTDNIHGDNDGSNVISTYVRAACIQCVYVCVCVCVGGFVHLPKLTQ